MADQISGQPIPALSPPPKLFIAKFFSYLIQIHILRFGLGDFSVLSRVDWTPGPLALVLSKQVVTMKKESSWLQLVH